MTDKLTNQTAFNIVYKHLLKQNKRCATSRGNCKYRHGALKCAIGALIPDELYQPAMDKKAGGYNVGALIGHFPAISNLFEDIDSFMLSSLQSIHDCSPPERWQLDLRSVAFTYKLVIPDAD